MNHSLQYLTWEHVGHRHNTRHFESSSYMDFQFKFLGSFQKCSKQPILTSSWLVWRTKYRHQIRKFINQHFCIFGIITIDICIIEICALWSMSVMKCMHKISSELGRSPRGPRPKGALRLQVELTKREN